MSLAYFPLYPDRYEADTAHLTILEDGAYNRLLRLCWRCPQCKMPDDDAWIYRQMRAHSSAERAAVDRVMAEFFKRGKGKAWNPKLIEIYAQVSEAHFNKSEAGKRGAAAKALKRAANASSDAKATLKQPEPEPDKKEERGKPLSRASGEKHDACIAHFNAVAARVGWAQVQRMTPARQAALSHRIEDIGGQEAWRDAIDRAARSPLLTGQTGRGWRADFDWLCKTANFTKLCEGNYDPRPSDPSGPTGNPHQPRAGGAHDSMVAAFAAVASGKPN